MGEDIISLTHTKRRCQYYLEFAPKYRRKNNITKRILKSVRKAQVRMMFVVKK